MWPFVPADAYATFGRGRHAAPVNFGDCLTDAVARLAQAPLAFVGTAYLEAALTAP